MRFEWDAEKNRSNETKHCWEYVRTGTFRVFGITTLHNQLRKDRVQTALGL